MSFPTSSSHRIFPNPLRFFSIAPRLLSSSALNAVDQLTFFTASTAAFNLHSLSKMQSHNDKVEMLDFRFNAYQNLPDRNDSDSHGSDDVALTVLSYDSIVRLELSRLSRLDVERQFREIQALISYVDIDSVSTQYQQFYSNTKTTQQTQSWCHNRRQTQYQQYCHVRRHGTNPDRIRSDNLESLSDVLTECDSDCTDLGFALLDTWHLRLRHFHQFLGDLKLYLLSEGLRDLENLTSGVIQQQQSRGTLTSRSVNPGFKRTNRDCCCGHWCRCLNENDSVNLDQLYSNSTSLRVQQMLRKVGSRLDQVSGFRRVMEKSINHIQKRPVHFSKATAAGRQILNTSKATAAGRWIFVFNYLLNVIVDQYDKLVRKRPQTSLVNLTREDGFRITTRSDYLLNPRISDSKPPSSVDFNGVIRRQKSYLDAIIRGEEEEMSFGFQIDDEYQIEKIERIGKRMGELEAERLARQELAMTELKTTLGQDGCNRNPASKWEEMKKEGGQPNGGSSPGEHEAGSSATSRSGEHGAGSSATSKNITQDGAEDAKYKDTNSYEVASSTAARSSLSLTRDPFGDWQSESLCRESSGGTPSEASNFVEVGSDDETVTTALGGCGSDSEVEDESSVVNRGKKKQRYSTVVSL